MWVFYICALIPIAVGFVFFLKDKKVAWQEWLAGCGVALLMAVIFHAISIWGMTSDEETWSGQIIAVTHYGEWVEEYEETHTETYTDADGNTHTRTYTTTEHDTHPEHWTATANYGTYEEEPWIQVTDYNEIKASFGNEINETGLQSTHHFGGSYDGGDRNYYVTYNNTGYVQPVTTIKRFENRVKAAPTLFSFAEVPEGVNVYNWPDNPDWRHSERLLGTAVVLIDQYKFDCMNTFLGPIKKVNVIMVGFGNNGPDYGQWQQAKWIGGKKNDLVLCFGGGTQTEPAQWAYVFGWSDKELAKKNLQTILLDNPINDDILPKISDEIIKNYEIKDWDEFDYIAIDPPSWSYWVYFIVMILTQGGLYLFFHMNDFDEGGRFGSYSRYLPRRRSYRRYR